MTDVDPGPPIFAAVRAFDVEALRREIAAGVDPDLHSPTGATPLHYAVGWRTMYQEEIEERIRERLACISLLLEAGASVDSVYRGRTPLHYQAHNQSPTYQAVIAALLEAGADPNFTGTCPHVDGPLSVLAMAARDGTAGVVRLLISAGALDLDRALELANDTNLRPGNCVPLLRAGASLPPHQGTYWRTREYIERIRAAGGYKAYEKAHRQRLVAIFLPKFPSLPVEMLERVLEFTWDIGGH